MLPFSAAKRRQNVATAEGRGKHLSRKTSPVRGERLSGLKNLSPLPGLGFPQTETTAFSRGYVLTPLRGSFGLIPNSSSLGVLNLLHFPLYLRRRSFESIRTPVIIVPSAKMTR